MTGIDSQPEWMGWDKIRNVPAADRAELSQWIYYLNRLRRGRARKTVCRVQGCTHILAHPREIKHEVCGSHNHHYHECQCVKCKAVREEKIKVDRPPRRAYKNFRHL